jgi:hypothetical protein
LNFKKQWFAEALTDRYIRMLLAPNTGEIYVSCQAMEVNGKSGIFNDGIG